eukprot:936005-Amphidinium_carterae.1
MAPRQVESSVFCTLNVCGANVSELEALAGEAMHEYGVAWLLALQEVNTSVPSGIHPLEHGLLVVGEAAAFRKAGWLI